VLRTVVYWSRARFTDSPCRLLLAWETLLAICSALNLILTRAGVVDEAEAVEVVLVREGTGLRVSCGEWYAPEAGSMAAGRAAQRVDGQGNW
jgi:hypothetical protein